MADGRWTMTENELNGTAGGFELPDYTSLPNHGKSTYVDDRDGRAPHRCAFCESVHVKTGTGGYGPGLGYRTLRCDDCGGQTHLVFKDDNERFL